MTADALDRALDELLPRCDGAHGDWQDVLARANVNAGAAAAAPPRHLARRPRLGRRWTVAIVALLALLTVLFATPAFGVRHALLDLFGRKNVSFSRSGSAPNEVKKQFADLAIGAPPRFAPQAMAGQARSAGTLLVNGHRRHLWVVPTRRGGYCYAIERSIVGCRQTRADRDVGKRGQFGVSSAWQIEKDGRPTLLEISGDLTAPSAAEITVHYADGATIAVPFIWVSKPIAAGFFGFSVPAAHQVPARRVVSVTLQDAHGRQLGVQTFPRQLRHPVRPRLPHPTHRPALPGLPLAPPVAPSAPLQQATADGFTVTVGHNEAVQFSPAGTTAAIEAADRHGVSVGCFRLTREFGIFTVRELSYGERRFLAGRPIGFQLRGVGTPFDGCEIEGSGGHLWPDRNGGHSPVEVPLTPRGGAFFADRAAARDLSLFVRSRRVQRIRHEPPPQALRDLRAAYGTTLARSRIRVARRGADTLVFRERSSTGKLFTVAVRRGRIAKQNVQPYALVF